MQVNIYSIVKIMCLKFKMTFPEIPAWGITFDYILFK